MAVKYTEEMLRQAVANSVSFAGTVRYLGLVETGGNHAHITRRIRALGIDTTHFTGQSWAKGLSRPRRTPEELLVKYERGAPRINGGRLRAALLRLGRSYHCAGCGNGGVWLMRPITLHVDHVNGDYLDCRPENLRFLCPNCHSQTPTHAGRNKRRAIPPVEQLELVVEGAPLSARGGT